MGFVCGLSRKIHIHIRWAKKMLRLYFNFQFQDSELLKEKTMHFLFKWNYLSMDLFGTDNWKNPRFFFQTYE